jgi:hypothetical protein
MHSPCKEVLDEHPLLISVERSLRRKCKNSSLLNYMLPRLSFVYPRVIWLRTRDESVGTIEENLTFTGDEVACAIGELMYPKGWFRRVVVDMSGTRTPGHRIEEMIVKQLTERFPRDVVVITDPNVEVTPDRPAERQRVIASIQTDKSLATLHIELPPVLDADTLSDFLTKHVTDRKLNPVDILEWDFKKVTKVNFEAISLISPIIHSLGHEYGVLAKITGLSLPIRERFERYGALEPMASYIINRTTIPCANRHPNIDYFPLTTYTADAFEEYSEILELCDARFLEMVKRNPTWFVEKWKISTSSTWVVENKRVEEIKVLIRDFKSIIKELVENVLQHSRGLGYIMMELDQSEGGGIRFYVGDTGVGFRRGLQSAYKFKMKTEADAISMFFLIVEKRMQRKSVSGTLGSGGRGLGRIYTILEKLAGNLTIQSGPSRAIFDPRVSRRPITLSTERFPIQGTHIHILVPSAK